MSPLVLVLVLFIFSKLPWYVGLLVLLGGALFFAFNLIVRQESMLYVPCVMPGMQRPRDNPEGMRSPSDQGIHFKDVYLKTSDGVRIHAWFMQPCDEPSRKKAATVLFCHANAGNMGLRMANFAELVKRLEINILAFDYRGYGNSEGSPSEEGLIEDALAAWSWLSSAASDGDLDGDRIFVFGRSLGGAVAVALARTLQEHSGRCRPCGLVLENTFTSISALVDTMFPFIAFQSLKDRFLRVRWETIDRIQDLEAPVLFLVGAKDEMIPPSHSRSLHSSAVKSVLRRCVFFPDGQHNDTWEKGGEKYFAAWTSFMAECESKDYLNSKTDIKDASEYSVRA